MRIRPTVMVRELFNGDAMAFPLADSSLIAYASDEADALLESEMFLRDYLSSLPAGQLARFIYPEETSLIEVEVMVHRPDLPKNLQPTTPIAFTCLGIPQKREQWVSIIALGHTFYLERGEEIAEAVEREVTRMVSARELGPVEYLALLPARSSTLHQLDFELERLERLDPSKVRSKREKLAREKRAHEARNLLSEIGVDLVKKMSRKNHAPLVGREQEKSALAALLTAREAMSVAVVGKPLAGKSALIRELVRDGSLTKPLVLTSGARLIAGQSGFGQWQERLHQVMTAAEEIDATLYFDDLGDLFAGQSGGSMDMAGALRPYMEDGRVRILGEVTPDGLEAHEHRHVSFFGALHRVRVEEMSAEETARVVRAHVKHSKKKSPDSVTLDEAAIMPLVELSERYLPYQSFPGKAMQILDDLHAIRDSSYVSQEKDTIKAEEVYQLFCVRTGIPDFLLREDQGLKRERIIDFFSERIIGQRESIERVSDVICAVKARLQPPGKPLATFLFVGPTGVGKTEVAKTLSSFLFGSPDRLVRFDMSEYMDSDAASRLIHGSSNGEGELTRRVRQQPFCALLLDEIEKAHPAVFDLLLQVCGEGRLTDARGRTTHFHNAIIIMTSNLGAAHRRDALGFGEASGEGASSPYMDEVRRHFRPEFVNRLDAVIGFDALSQEQALAVCRVTLRRVCNRPGIAEHRVDLQVSDAATEHLALHGHSEAYGARALRRYLDHELVSPLALLFSRHASQMQGATVMVEHSDEEGGIIRPGAGRLIEAHQAGELMVRVYRSDHASLANELEGFEEIAALRRRSRELIKLNTIAELRGHLDFLLAQINYGDYGKKKKDQRSSSEKARLHEEYFRLDEIYKKLSGPLADIEDAEELAIAALFDGEPLAPYVEEAESAWRSFSHAMVYALFARATQRDEITFTLRRVNGPGDIWWKYFSSLFDSAQERGWKLTFHLDGDRSAPSSGEWNHAVRWGPPRTMEQFGALLEARADDFYYVLVRAKGSYAGSLLALEAGRHVFTAGGDSGDHELFCQVRLLRYSPDESQWANTLDVQSMDLDKIKKIRPVRQWGYSPHTILLLTADGRARMHIRIEEYWKRFEEVAFQILLHRLRRS